MTMTEICHEMGMDDPAFKGGQVDASLELMWLFSYHGQLPDDDPDRLTTVQRGVVALRAWPSAPSAERLLGVRSGD